LKTRTKTDQSEHIFGNCYNLLKQLPDRNENILWLTEIVTKDYFETASK